MKASPSVTIKLSAPETKQFWEVEVLYEDAHILALNKPACLLTSPDRYDPNRPNLMRLLHEGIRAAKPWAVARSLTYVSNVHRLDYETSGVILLAKTKPVLTHYANLFGSNKPVKTYVALAQGMAAENTFTVDAPIGPQPNRPEMMRIDLKHGKKSVTRFEVLTAFRRYTLFHCFPITGRTHQIRVHLRSVKLPICGDSLYGGDLLFLSSLKKTYDLKAGKEERPLISTTALHAESLTIPAFESDDPIVIQAAWPKDLTVAVKYLKRYGGL